MIAALRSAAAKLSLAGAILAACRGESRQTAASDSGAATARIATAVAQSPAAAESLYSIPVQLARFKSSIPTAPTRLEHGEASLDALVREFARALDAGDRERLQQLQLSRAEFAYLYYPDSPLAQPPYELDPELMWMQITDRSTRGLTRAIASLSNGRLEYRSFRCEREPMRRGPITLYNSCTVTHVENGQPLTEPLFGSVIARDGVFKFVGFSNHL